MERAEKILKVLKIRLLDRKNQAESIMKRNADEGAYGMANFWKGHIDGLETALTVLNMVSEHSTEEDLDAWIEYETNNTK